MNLALPLMAQDKPGEAILPEGAPAAMRWVDQADLLRHANYLASPALGGRYTGSVGQERAAAYIAEHFNGLGLEPLGDEGEDGQRQWLQRYPVGKTSLDESGTFLMVGEDRYTEGFGVLAGKGSKQFRIEGDWVVESTRRNPDAGPLAGKIPVVLLQAPRLKTSSPEAQFSVAFQVMARARGMVNRLATRGATVVVFLMLDDNCGVPSLVNYIGLAPGKPLLTQEADMGMGAMGSMLAGKIPQVFASAKLSRTILRNAGIVADESTEYAEVKGKIGEAQPFPGKVHLTIVEEQDAHAVNVVGLLRGSDPELASEAVIFTAHMDHMGKRMDGEIFNGADDNASGSAGLLEIAEAFARAEKAPRRSVIFLSVSGEELGLWGSRYFSDHPTWPIRQIVANVNTDMIGRTGPESGDDEVTVTPSYRHNHYSTLVQDAARMGEKLGMRFTNGDKYYTRSDHFNFARRGVPVVFFCSGEHEDYHQVTDEPDKLNGAKMETLARLAFWTGHAAAQAQARPDQLGRCDGWMGAPRKAK